MRNTHYNFANTIMSLRKFGTVGCVATLAIMFIGTAMGAVVQRGSAQTSTVTTTNRASVSSRLPTMTAKYATTSNTTTSSGATTTPEPEPEPEYAPPTIEDKSDQFADALGAAASSGATNDASDTSLAEMVRRQRAAMDADDATAAADRSREAAKSVGGMNSCDTDLRACMQEKCGKNFLKCRGDGDTIWGDKMDACRRDTKCTGTEYRALAAEIKADRDMNAHLDAYNTVLECGNSYNDCIVTECGTTFTKCLGKVNGDAAISRCEKIAKDCVESDSGLASRTMNVFATLRQDAEVQVKKDEQRLYDLREEMASQCQRLGAMFDERSLTCVFTVNFFAANSTTPYASKKAYSGGTFDCTQNWFGIDITTFKENAYRYTRSQTAATSALMGSGVGMAVGSITSGAIGRAIDRKKADDALNDAKKEYEESQKPSESDTTDTTDETSAVEEEPKVTDNKKNSVTQTKDAKKEHVTKKEKTPEQLEYEKAMAEAEKQDAERQAKEAAQKAIEDDPNNIYINDPEGDAMFDKQFQTFTPPEKPAQ